MKAFRSVISTLALAFLAAALIACQSDDQSKDAAAPRPQTQEQQQAVAQPAQPATEPAQSTAAASVSEISGTVEDTDSGIVITSDTGEYTVSGQDLSAMIGKKVKVTGAVEESGGRYMIRVESVSEAQ